MQRRELCRTTTPSIAPSSALSLTGSGWRCLHRDTWDAQHTDFYAKNSSLYKSAIWRFFPPLRHRKPGDLGLIDAGSWVIGASDGQLLARLNLQKIVGDFNHGLLFVDVKDDQSSGVDLSEVFAQLITSTFMTMRLDTQKIIPLSAAANYHAGTICDVPETPVMSFNPDILPEVTTYVTYQVEQHAWLASAAGQKSLEALSWLKKRIERTEAIRKLANEEPKKSWVFSILTFGRKRRRKEIMVHPLDQMRSMRD
jgi:hypothetical protein